MSINDRVENVVSSQRIAGSFRDPSGYVYCTADGEIRRSVLPYYVENFRLFQESGLKEALLEKKYLIPFTVLSANPDPASAATLAVEKIPFISYPYEWSFSQLRDAALLTLRIQLLALQHGMMLKDASAYNVQFQHGRAIFIDLLSFEEAGDKPWAAYGQFCTHFLAPLALMAKTDLDLNLLLTQCLDGVPLELAAKLLPFSARFNLGLFLHLFAHAKMQTKHNDVRQSAAKARQAKISSKAKMLLAEGLLNAVGGLRRPASKTEWADYYADTNYNDAAFAAKKQLIAEFSQEFSPQRVLDIGANTGVFSRLAAKAGNLVVAADIDPVAVDEHYVYLKKEKVRDILPLRVNLVNPPPAIGWDNLERGSFLQRCDFDLVMALALIHHLAITNNLPLPMLARTLAGIGKYLLIEFVPKEDSQVQRLLASREDIFPDYQLEGFLQAFQQEFTLLRRQAIPESKRELFLFQSKK